MKSLHVISFILVIIGGLNWGLVAIGYWTNQDWNVVNLLLGAWPPVEYFVYFLVGVAAIILAVGHKKDCRTCNPGGSMAM